jgi:hypothetical protein
VATVRLFVGAGKSQGAATAATEMSEPSPMKLWQVVCGFGEFQSVLRDVFADPKWRDAYGQTLSRWNEYVHAQNRTVLDGLVPVELTREIAARCTGLQYCFSEDGQLRRTGRQWPAGPGATFLSALEVHDRFGGAVIEEIEEKGVATVQ